MLKILEVKMVLYIEELCTVMYIEKLWFWMESDSTDFTVVYSEFPLSLYDVPKACLQRSITLSCVPWNLLGAVTWRLNEEVFISALWALGEFNGQQTCTFRVPFKD